jgi:hypothetical protein
MALSGGRTPSAIRAAGSLALLKCTKRWFSMTVSINSAERPEHHQALATCLAGRPEPAVLEAPRRPITRGPLPPLQVSWGLVTHGSSSGGRCGVYKRHVTPCDTHMSASREAERGAVAAWQVENSTVAAGDFNLPAGLESSRRARQVDRPAFTHPCQYWERSHAIILEYSAATLSIALAPNTGH